MRTTVNWRQARLRWLGVRLGGVGFLPTPWRWGYGWKWPRSAGPKSDTYSFTAQDQRKVYEAILKNAAEADEKARERN